MSESLGVTIPEAAKLLGISVHHFKNLRKLGKIGPRARKLGRSTRFIKAELEDWLKAGCPDALAWEKREVGK